MYIIYLVYTHSIYFSLGYTLISLPRYDPSWALLNTLLMTGESLHWLVGARMPSCLTQELRIAHNSV